VFDWNDVRYFLEVARTGSTLTASRALGVSQPTVARRIAALETALSMVLFERHPTGYRITEQGRELTAAADEMEVSANRLRDAARHQSRRVSGTVRVTCNEVTANHYLSRALRAFRQSYPEVRVELVAEDRYLDIDAGEADIAVRAGERPIQGDLVVRKLADMPWAVFCSRDYAAEHGTPTSVADLARHVFLGGDGPLDNNPALVWARRCAPDLHVDYRFNTVTNYAGGIKAGLGVGVLTVEPFCFDPDMVVCFTLPTEVLSEVWLVTHERLRDVARVRALIDFLVSYLTLMFPPNRIESLPLR
jgi:DNA-binding transcriptional LysR family regulator